MTGRELIMYILANRLEDEPVICNGRLAWFMTVDEAAVKMDVGPETVLAWVKLGMLPSIVIAEGLYIPTSARSPREAYGQLQTD